MRRAKLLQIKGAEELAKLSSFSPSFPSSFFLVKSGKAQTEELTFLKTYAEQQITQ